MVKAFEGPWLHASWLARAGVVRHLLVHVSMPARTRVAALAHGLVLALALGCDPEAEAEAGLAADVERVREAGAEAIAGEQAGGVVAGPGELAGAGARVEPGLATERTPAAPGVARADSEPGPIVLRRPWPPTALPLALLATMGAPPPAPSRATIRDDGSGVIASYRPGDHVREDVEVLSIEDGLVELSNAGEVEYLSISEIPVELSADDVFYPDLVAELGLSGSMEDSVPMPPGPEYTLKTEAYSWATPRTVALLRDAIREYARGRKAPKLHIGDISLKNGGPFSPHLSHQDGRDVDIAYVLHDRSRFGVATSSNLDRRHTWQLLRTLLDTRSITYVFVDYEVQRMLYEHALGEGLTAEQLDPWFQYPYGRRAARGIIRHWKGHRDHFHVRFAG